MSWFPHRHMMKIAVIGTHGVGKTTLAYQIATEAKQRGKNAHIVHEVARSCPFPLNDSFGMDGAQWIVTTQIKRELEAKSQKADMIVCDRSAYDPICYLNCSNESYHSYDAFRYFAEEWTKTYDRLIYVIPTWQPLTDDGIRSLDLTFQQRVNDEFVYFINMIRHERDLDILSIHDYEIFTGKVDPIYNKVFGNV